MLSSLPPLIVFEFHSMFVVGLEALTMGEAQPLEAPTVVVRVVLL